MGPPCRPPALARPESPAVRDPARYRQPELLTLRHLTPYRQPELPTLRHLVPYRRKIEMTAAMCAVSLQRMPANPPTALPHAQTRQTAGGPEQPEQTPLAALWRTREYLRRYYRQLALMLAAAITAAGAEIAIPLLIKGIIDGPIAHGNARALLPLGLAATALGVLQAALNLYRRWVQASAVTSLEQSMRDALYAHLQHLHAGFHDDWQSGQLLSRATTDLAAIRRFAGFGTFGAGLDLLPNAVSGIILLLGALAVSRNELSLGGLVAFITLALLMVWPIESMGYILASGQEAATAAQRVYEIFDTDPAITDRAPGQRGPRAGARKQHGLLQFDHVTFCYPGVPTPVLRDVTLELEPGETVALVGPNGSGKSTLLQLVPRLAEVSAGSIRLDGTDVRDLPLATLRSAVGCAFEDPTLFSVSVRENVSYGRPGADEDEVLAALAAAQAGFVADLPWGLDTRIGEQGMALSGGQRQRVALARAILARPTVLLLDDPLSALDVHTEAKVTHALEEVMAESTALVVAQRPSTVVLADRVALLDRGVIVATGSHRELLATQARYRSLMSGSDDEGPGLDPAGDRGLTGG